jgi:hypothetical protein
MWFPLPPLAGFAASTWTAAQQSIDMLATMNRWFFNMCISPSGYFLRDLSPRREKI